MEQTSTRDQSAADLVRRLSEQTSVLVRQELRLAQVELQEKGKHAGIGAGLFGGAGVLGLYGIGALVAAAILALDLAVAGWLAALIVAVLLFAVGALLGLTGKKQVDQATPPQPERAIYNTQKDVEAVKEAAKR